MTPRRILLGAHPTVGHTMALRAIAHVLRARDADTRFAIAAPPAPGFIANRLPEVMKTAVKLPHDIARDGTPVWPLRPAPSSIWHALRLPFTQGYDELEHAVSLFTAGLATQVEAMEKLAATWRPDVVVADYLFFAGWLLAERLGVPFVALYHSGLPFPVAGAAPFGSGLDDDSPRESWVEAQRGLTRITGLVDARIAQARSELGLPEEPPQLLARPYATLNLLATHPALEREQPDFGANSRFVGPCLGSRAAEASDFPFELLSPTKFKVYVSMGTVFNARPEVFEAVLDALDHPDVQVIVSAGASHDRLARLARSPDLLIFRRVPQVALLSTVDLVISHAGNNTTNETLAAGRPLVLVPVGAEQVANASRVVALGAGLRLSFPPQKDAVRVAVDRIRADPGFTTRARAIGKALEGVDGATAAAEAILTLTATP